MLITEYKDHCTGQVSFWRHQHNMLGNHPHRKGIHHWSPVPEKGVWSSI